MSEQQWFVLHRGKKVGPLTAKQLKHLASTHQIKPDSQVSNDGENWRAADRVKGLFVDLVVTPKAVARVDEPVDRPAASPPKTIVIPEAMTPVVERKACPFCGEFIAEAAMKCKHCGEFLDATLRTASRSVSHAPQPIVAAAPVVVQNTNIVNFGGKRWSPLVAALLSLIIPGLGQLYKGQPINGLAWFVVVIVGYVFFIFPGVILHLCCIAGAALGDPYR